MIRGRIGGTWVIGGAMLVACQLDTTGEGEGTGTGTSTGEGTGTGSPTSAGSESGSVGATEGADGTSSGSSGPSDTGDSGDPPGCGDGIVADDEECDDGNAMDTDGCLSTCVIPRSCAHILVERPEASDGQYQIELPEGPVDVYCDMTTDGGGWMLAAKVDPTDENTAARSEPRGWFDMVLEVGLLASPQLQPNGPLASHGASRLMPLVREDSLARFELVAANDLTMTRSWYKQVVAEDLPSWFDFGGMQTMVCSDREMTMNCSMDGISPTGGPNSSTRLGGMSLDHYGLSTDGFPIHMRLSDDANPELSGVCSSTLNDDGNAWPDSYAQHWGNGLRIWLR